MAGKNRAESTPLLELSALRERVDVVAGKLVALRGRL